MRPVFAFLFGLLCLLAAAPDARAQAARGAPDLPVMLTADELIADDDLGLVTAQGNVEVAQGERILRADTLTFNRRTNMVTASGNVSLVEPGGEVAFAEYVELTSDLREGVMRNIRLLLADQSRFAAVTARRGDGSRTTMRRATYSPCEPCAENPERAPMWQIRANRIRHDQERKEVVYDDAWIELAGVPVAYTPYLAHPDGTVPRKSGFLFPEIASSSRTGVMVATPYFLAISPSADATVTPIYVGGDNPLLALEYRQRFATAETRFTASGLSTQRSGEGFGRWRGHFQGGARADLDDVWRTGFDALRASDKTYIERYRMRQRFGFLDQDVLESRAYVEGFSDRGYAALNAFAFQDLRPEGDPSLSPLVMPAGAYSWTGEPGAHGGRLGFEGSAVSIYRSRGTVSRRVTSIGSWSLPHTTRSGEIYTLTASLQGDVFDVDRIGAVQDGFRPNERGVNVRALPQLGLSWRLPLIRRAPGANVLVEPITAVYVAPNLGNQRDLPNEESRGLTFDDTNLFRGNRFSGVDRLESGQRFVYGLNTELFRSSGERLGVFVGQQYRANTEAAMARHSGLDTRFSDFVGRVLVSPYSWLVATHRFQYDNANRELLRSATGLRLGGQALNYSISHIRVDRTLQPSANLSINQIAHSASIRATETWRLRGRLVQALNSGESGILLAGATLIYEDDCFLFGIDLARRNIGRAEIPPDTALLFRFALRNLGDFRLQGL
jgi:LPS-assembly protein